MSDLPPKVIQTPEALVLPEGGAAPTKVTRALVGLGLLLLFGTLGGFAILFTLSMILESFAVLALSVVQLIGSGLVLQVLGALAVWFHNRPRTLTIDATGVHQRWRASLPVEAVRIEGEVGDSIHVVAMGETGEQLLLAKRPSLKGSGYSLERIEGLAREVAERMGVPIKHQLDRSAWKRWTEDPAYRRAVAFRRGDTAYRERYPSLAQATPIAPPDARQSHHHLWWRGLRLDARTLQHANQALAVSDILKVAVRIQPTWPDSPVPPAPLSHNIELRLLTVERILTWTLCPYDRELLAHAAWIRDQVQQAVQQAQRSEPAGEQSEVPKALQAIVSER